MTSQQSVNTKRIACFPSSLFFVIIKRDFITDYLNVPAFTSEFLVRAQTISYRDEIVGVSDNLDSLLVML